MRLRYRYRYGSTQRGDGQSYRAGQTSSPYCNNECSADNGRANQAGGGLRCTYAPCRVHDCMYRYRDAPGTWRGCKYGDIACSDKRGAINQCLEQRERTKRCSPKRECRTCQRVKPVVSALTRVTDIGPPASLRTTATFPELSRAAHSTGIDIGMPTKLAPKTLWTPVYRGCRIV